MVLFNRKIPISKIPTKALSLLRLVFGMYVFYQPFSIFKSYLFKKPLAEKWIKLNNGLHIFLTSSVYDVITAVVIFNKKEYGLIQAGSTIVDIGANIGMFSLYAAKKGAAKIYAIEPNKGNYELLEKNIKTNQFEDIIIPIQRAVSKAGIKEVFVSKDSSPYSSTKYEQKDPINLVAVSTIDLGELLMEYKIEKIDLLKIDCESAEHGFIPYWSLDVLSKIKEIRMELHSNPNGKNRYDTLDHLLENGYRKVKDEDDVVWLENTSHF